MGVLTDIPDNRIHTGKGWLVINPAFDAVLEIQKLYKEEGLTEYEKTGQALYMLVKNRWNLRLFGPAEKSRLLEEVYRKFIAVKQRPKIRQSPFPILDFEEDGDYIYASFMQDYGIDLIKEQGRLPWKKFLYLFDLFYFIDFICHICRTWGNISQPNRTAIFHLNYSRHTACEVCWAIVNIRYRLNSRYARVQIAGKIMPSI